MCIRDSHYTTAMSILAAMPPVIRLFSGTFMTFMALVWGSLGVYVWRRYSRLMTKGAPAVGTIVDVEMKCDNSGMKWAPKVEFQTPDNQKIVFSGTAQDDNRKFIKGRSVKVVYMPANPTEAEIQTGFP